jgi:hypothetical protein
VAGMDQLSEWRAARMAVMASGSWMAATGLMRPPQKGHLRASRAHTRELRPRTPRRRPSSFAGGAWVRRAPQRGQGGKPGQGVGTMRARTRRGSRAAGPVKTPWKRRSAS